MTYRFKDIEFNTDLKYYKVSPGNKTTYEEDGLFCIEYPNVSRYTKKLEEVTFNYNGAIFRRKNVNAISVRIYIIDELEINIVQEDEYRLEIYINSETPSDILLEYLNGANLEHISGSISQYKEINILLNRDIVIDGRSTPMNLRSTVAKYSLDLTSTIAPFMDFWNEYFKSEKFQFMNALGKVDPNITEVVYFNFNEYLLNNSKHLLYSMNNIEEYRLPLTFKICTSSISKHERLLSELKSLKWMTNVVRVPIIDKNKVNWVIPIMWNHDFSTNEPSDIKSESHVSYEITVNCYIITYTIRNEESVKINKINGLLNYVNTKDPKNINKRGRIKEYRLNIS